jgi:hypothetical protein
VRCPSGNGPRDAPRARDQAAAEAQQRRDILGLRQPHSRQLVDDVVEAQIEPLMLAEAVEGGRRGRAGIEDREHMRDAGGAMARQLGDAAHGDVEIDKRAGTGHGAPDRRA